MGITISNHDLTWGLDPATKQVRVASFHCKTVHIAVEVTDAVGVNYWSEIHPSMMVKCTGVGTSRDYWEIVVHLQVKKGELLEGTGQNAYLKFGIW